MPFPVLFGITVVLGLAAWGAVSWHYIWPALRERSSPENLKPILMLHGFRFLGLAFVVPGVASPELPAAFAQPVAYGDLATAVLALLALTTLGIGIGFSADLGFQYLRNGGPALRLLPGKPHITPGYARLVRRCPFYSDCLRASSSHNARPDVSRTAANDGRCAGTKQTKWRLMPRWFVSLCISADLDRKS